MNNTACQYSPETTISSPPPHSEAVEKSILGSCLTSEKALNTICRQVDENHFYITANRRLFREIRQDWHDFGEVDPVLIAERQPDLALTISESYENAATSPNPEQWIAGLKEKFRFRQLQEKISMMQQAISIGDVELVDRLQRELGEITRGNDNIEKIFHPIWSNKPEIVQTILTLSGHRIGSPGNMVVFISAPGTGKSSGCEAIAARSLNPECDGLGFSLCDNCTVVYLDTERSIADHWNSWHRMTRRAGINEGNAVNVRFELLSLIKSCSDRRQYLESIITEGKAGLIIIDGLADFVKSVNDESECNDFLYSILALAKQHNTALFSTIHHNPKDNKPRGWLGTLAMIRAESVLIIKREGEQRTITMDFAYGKNRSAYDRLESYFTWDEEKMMFISCENQNTGKPAAQKRNEEILTQLTGRSMSYAELLSEIQRITGKNQIAAKGLYQRWHKAGKIERSGELWEVVSF